MKFGYLIKFPGEFLEYLAFYLERYPILAAMCGTPLIISYMIGGLFGPFLYILSMKLFVYCCLPVLLLAFAAQVLYRAVISLLRIRYVFIDITKSELYVKRILPPEPVYFHEIEVAYQEGLVELHVSRENGENKRIRLALSEEAFRVARILLEAGCAPGPYCKRLLKYRRSEILRDFQRFHRRAYYQKYREISRANNAQVLKKLRETGENDFLDDSFCKELEKIEKKMNAILAYYNGYTDKKPDLS